MPCRRSFLRARVVALSARTGEGLEEWLRLALGGASRFARVLDVDYGAYAEAEASLGWLNARVAVRATQPFAADEWLRGLLQGLAVTLEAQGAIIVHLKAQVDAPAVQLKASVTRAGRPLYWDMWSPHAETDRAQLVLNARVECRPRCWRRPCGVRWKRRGQGRGDLRGGALGMLPAGAATADAQAGDEG